MEEAEHEETSMAIEFNNNIDPLKSKNIDLCQRNTGALGMHCNSLAEPTSCSEFADFQIINIDPCYVTAISNYKYETVKLSAAHVTRGACEYGRLAQMKANTKLKRTRKPYHIPNRCSLSPNIHHSRASSISNGDHEAVNIELRNPVFNRSQSNRVVSLFDDRPQPSQKTCNLFRSRSLEDLRSLAKTTTVMFNSLQCQQDKQLDEVSDVMSKLHVTDQAPSQS